ncbi:MAG TPA: aminoglycoside phosphotransferase family protein [Microlunatus sp.]|nr:aminoglycoside phosphotransferase family protein [Microlunatus sp.]
MLPPPTFASVDDYGARLGDVEFWRPYVDAALADCGLSAAEMVSGFEGTYPTLVGEHLVVKLFGYFPGWRRSVEAEIAANKVVERSPLTLAPKIIATGSLFPTESDHWPFLVFPRLGGRAWRDAQPAPATARSVAAELGREIRSLHRLQVPERVGVHEDWLATNGADAVERHREWGSLPRGLVDAIPAYLAGYRPAPACLLHGDLTEDHIFVDDQRLVGVIDWGDALLTDPFYELGALHLGAFAGDRHLLACFLQGYGWTIDPSFADHALQVALMHQFDLFGAFHEQAEAAHSLSELARTLWTPQVRPSGDV